LHPAIGYGYTLSKNFPPDNFLFITALSAIIRILASNAFKIQIGLETPGTPKERNIRHPERF
jgi:hypothetical protein